MAAEEHRSKNLPVRIARHGKSAALDDRFKITDEKLVDGHWRATTYYEKLKP